MLYTQCVLFFSFRPYTGIDEYFKIRLVILKKHLTQLLETVLFSITSKNQNVSMILRSSLVCICLEDCIIFQWFVIQRPSKDFGFRLSKSQVSRWLKLSILTLDNHL